MVSINSAAVRKRNWAKILRKPNCFLQAIAAPTRYSDIVSGIPSGNIYDRNSNIRRKFRSQTSDNMDR